MLGRRLIEKQNLLSTAVTEDDSLLVEDEKKHERHTNMYASAVFQLILAIGLGTIFSYFLTKTGLTFPVYIGAMLAAALIRNIAEYSGKATIHMGEINDLGGICLSLFLGMAMITLKLLGTCCPGTSACDPADRTGLTDLCIYLLHRV